jgi:hypothetical protein
MTSREQAQRIEALLRARYPEADVDVMRVFGGLRVEIISPGDSTVAIIGTEYSALLAAWHVPPEWVTP